MTSNNEEVSRRWLLGAIPSYFAIWGPTATKHAKDHRDEYLDKIVRSRPARSPEEVKSRIRILHIAENQGMQFAALLSTLLLPLGYLGRERSEEHFQKSINELISALQEQPIGKEAFAESKEGSLSRRAFTNFTTRGAMAGAILGLTASSLANIAADKSESKRLIQSEFRAIDPNNVSDPSTKEDYIQSRLTAMHLDPYLSITPACVVLGMLLLTTLQTLDLEEIAKLVRFANESNGKFSIESFDIVNKKVQCYVPDKFWLQEVMDNNDEIVSILKTLQNKGLLELSHFKD